ncbi:MAG: hypothetical protein OXI87_07860 [Albidovulum sp.]|nr:hypothetical protein [Albidovulum sp.]MDE0304782.1 hypothetical protein [Albidovulum sp.]MDE0534567.1 hypothetical protein [Albidovulum sp.]
MDGWEVSAIRPVQWNGCLAAIAFLAAVFLWMLSVAEGRSDPTGNDVCLPPASATGAFESQQPVRLRIHNGAGSDIACHAALAHWFSQRLGAAEPGNVLEIQLCHVRDTGVLYLLNDIGDRMPVEAIWCRRASAPGDPGARIPLPLAAGPAPNAIARRCGDGARQRLQCSEVRN